jgi:hypothetical protein
MEEWREVDGVSLYSVSNQGKVKNNNSNRILSLKKDKDGYLEAALSLGKQNHKMYRRVHRLVADAFIPNPQTMPVIDHINHLKDDNRVENLRWATFSQNAHHREKRMSQAQSQYFGVWYDKNPERKTKWRAAIRRPNNGGTMIIGHYATEEEAARAYDEKARELYGEFARLNFP